MKNLTQLRLRDATHAHHVRLNHHPLLKGLIKPNCPLVFYQRVLVAYYHLYQDMELRINEYLEQHEVGFDYSVRQKLSWLESDLQFFNIDPYSYANWPVNSLKFPKIEQIGQLIGLLYPIEGSTLGGQFISSHLDLNHGMTCDQGAQFFNGYGKKTTERWNQFCEFADSIQDQEFQCVIAEVTASHTFNAFEEVLYAYYGTEDQ